MVVTCIPLLWRHLLSEGDNGSGHANIMYDLETVKPAKDCGDRDGAFLLVRRIRSELPHRHAILLTSSVDSAKHIGIVYYAKHSRCKSRVSVWPGLEL